MFTNVPLHESAIIWRFYLTVLAAWRMTHLLAEEDGPWNAIASAARRQHLWTSDELLLLFEPLDISTTGAQLNNSWAGFFVYWMALSGAACLFQRMTDTPETGFARIGAIDRNDGTK